MEAHPGRDAALVRPEAAGHGDSGDAEVAVGDWVRGRRARERLRQAWRRMAEVPRRRHAQSVRLPSPSRRAARGQAGGDRGVQSGRRQSKPDHPLVPGGRLQVERSREEDRGLGERDRREGEAAQDARRVPQSHDRLQPHRRRVPGGTCSPIGRRRTSSCNSIPAMPPRWKACPSSI